ncbi:MAG: alpha/beta hydrolase domain-containing protein [Acidobacteria bacterium]|nr:alpha/beta hydrolase domain-containing protein [Acidobacteriota bacterium]
MRQLFVFAALLAGSAPAAMVRMEITSQQDVLGGASFGSSGPYELVRARAYFAVDPKSPANSRITDIAFAPRNAAGLVEFSADVVMLRPKDPRSGNGTLLLESPNRGGMGMLALYNRASGSQYPVKEEHFGDGYLLREGYTLAWVGWQHDVPKREGLLRAYLPVAQGVTGLVRGEFTFAKAADRIPLGDSEHLAYPVADPSRISLTVRDSVHGVRKPVPSAAWHLDGDAILLKQLATPGQTYEFIYPGAQPAVAGLGMAATRDFVSSYKREGRVRFALGLGTSQSAMFLKALLYEGFNADEQGKSVFDGLQPHVAGGRRATFERFTQPSRTSGPYRNASFSTTDQFPYSDTEAAEPVTGRRDSLLSRARAANVIPKIVYTNSSYEYYGSSAALLHTTLDGKHDLPLPTTTRLYLLTGGQHGPAAFPPKRGPGQNLPNWNDYKWALRATLQNLRAWVVDGIPPPPSRYPSLASGTLKKGKPAAYRTQYLDFGPDYLSKSIVTHQPPKPGPDYEVLVPTQGPDGNETSGLRMPWVAEPLGQFTGWNLRSPSIGAPGELLGQTGSFLPYPPARVKAHYDSRANYTSRVQAAAEQLANDRLLLRADLPAIVRFSERVWDWIAELPGPERFEPSAGLR